MTSISNHEQDNPNVALRAAVGLIVVLFALFLLVLTFSILREKSDAQRRAEDRALSASQVVATNARWITELSRQALARIDDSLGPDIGSDASIVQQIISDAISRLPGNVTATVVAADGRALLSTDPSAKGIDVHDRDYFAELAKGQYWYTSSLLISRLSGAQVFVFSKRLERNGAFAGAAVISFEVSVLKDVWDSLDLDEISTVSLVRSDGQLVARYPFAEGPLDLSQYVLFTKHLKASDVGTYPATSPADGMTRIVGYRRVPGTPFIALAAISTDSAYALFWRNTAVTLFFALPTALALAITIAWILRLLRNDQKRRKELTDALALNQMLVRDTHHRVKNNLQSIMSMVRMHGLPEKLKADLQARISAMSAVHEHLYRLDKFSEVSADTLIPAIVEPLKQAFDHSAVVTYDIDPLVIDRDHATPLALLVNELVTNSLKYAFLDGREGNLRIALKATDNGEAVLSVEDDGVGFDKSVVSTGLGGRLIRAMVMQLKGVSSYSFDKGTRFEVRLVDPATFGPKAQPTPAADALQPASA